jgi:hypothetical protein
MLIVPILLVYASYRGVDLRVWGPYPSGFSSPSGKYFATFTPLVMSVTLAPDGHELLLKEYLTTPIGAVPYPRGQDEATAGSKWYTPTDLIKWIANKEGGARLQLKPMQTFELVANSWIVEGDVSIVGSDGIIEITNNDDFLVRTALLQIAKSTIILIDQVL